MVTKTATFRPFKNGPAQQITNFPGKEAKKKLKKKSAGEIARNFGGQSGFTAMP
jgi:hypothetical protein